MTVEEVLRYIQLASRKAYILTHNGVAVSYTHLESDRSVVTRTAVEIAERHKAALELPDMEPPEL